MSLRNGSQNSRKNLLEIDFLYNELGICSLSLEDLESVPSSSLSASSSSQFYPPSDPFTVSIATPTAPSRDSKTHSPLLSLDDEDQSDVAYQRIFAKFVSRVQEAEAEGRSIVPGSSTPIGLKSFDPSPSLLSHPELYQESFRKGWALFRSSFVNPE
ncbi:hypothetical protein EV360DRAFT_91046 [Lentinula raphanica]|nr:hypothetical protein EV360DRAFT_91046 [Lentinula raphanica]